MQDDEKKVNSENRVEALSKTVPPKEPLLEFRYQFHKHINELPIGVIAMAAERFNQLYGQKSQCVVVLMLYKLRKHYCFCNCEAIDCLVLPDSAKYYESSNKTYCTKCKTLRTLNSQLPIIDTRLSLEQWFKGYYYWHNSRVKGKHTSDTPQTRLLPVRKLSKILSISPQQAAALINNYKNHFYTFWKMLPIHPTHYKENLKGYF